MTLAGPSNYDPQVPSLQPDGRGMELDYPIDWEAAGSRTVHSYAIGFLLSTLALSLVATPAFRFLAPYLTTPLALVLLLGGSLLCTFLRFKGELRLADLLVPSRALSALVFARNPLRRFHYFATLCLGPAIYMLAQLVYEPTVSSAVLLLTLVLVLLAVLADQVAAHYVAWLHAVPTTERQCRNFSLELWGAKSLCERLAWWGSPIKTGYPKWYYAAVQQVERRRYPLVFLGVLTSGVAGLVVFVASAQSVFAGMYAIATTALALLVLGAANAAFLWGVRPSLSRTALSVVWDSLASFLTYNRHHSLVAGVFLSPSGWWAQRAASVRAALLVTSLLLTPLAAYYPLPVLLTGSDSWARAAVEDTTVEKMAAGWRPWSRGREAAHISAPPTLNDARENLTLTPLELRHYQHLSPERAQSYLAAKAAVSHQRRLADFYGRRTTQFEDRLMEIPELWLWTAARGALSLDPFSICALVVGLLASLLAPFALLFAVLFAVGSRVLLHHHGFLRADGFYSDDLMPWQVFSDRLRHSRHEEERNHLFLGLVAYSDTPVLLHRDILVEHTAVHGGAGSGKTALGVTPLLAQLIDRRDSTVVIIDLKGDMACFEDCRQRAASRGMRFSWFTSKAKHSTYCFNPFEQAHFKDALTLQQKAEVVLKALGLEHQLVYGQSHFSRASRHVLELILEEYPEVDSFKSLKEVVLADGDAGLRALRLTDKQIQDAGELTAVIRSLSKLPALNATKTNTKSSAFDARIDFSGLLSTPQVAYLLLPAAEGAATAREIARLAIESLFSAASTRPPPGRFPVYLAIDEFQVVASDTMEVLLEQARSMKVGIVLASQTPSNLGTELAAVIETNTQTKQVFSASDSRLREAIVKASGEAEGPGSMPDPFTVSLASMNMAECEAFNASYGMVEGRLGPRLTQNDVIRASDRPWANITRTRSKGFAQFDGLPVFVRSLYHIPKSVADERAEAPWPPLDEFTVLTDGPPEDPGAPLADAPRRVPPTAPAPAALPDDYQTRLDSIS